jgi:predicted dehydrogenase
VPAHYNRVPQDVPAGPPLFTVQLLVRLADAIHTGAPVSPDFADALACHQLLEAIQAASDTGTKWSALK